MTEEQKKASRELGHMIAGLIFWFCILLIFGTIAGLWIKYFWYGLIFA